MQAQRSSSSAGGTFDHVGVDRRPARRCRAAILQGTTTSLQGNILNNATMCSTTERHRHLRRHHVGHRRALIKVGTGTLTLTGTNSYTGGTTVSGGILQGNTSSLQGNILNNATVIVQPDRQRHLCRHDVGHAAA